jgi:hypothetical protein
MAVSNSGEMSNFIHHASVEEMARIEIPTTTGYL